VADLPDDTGRDDQGVRRLEVVRRPQRSRFLRDANAGIAVDELLARRGGDLRALLTRWLAESRFARELLGDRLRLDEAAAA
jgi:hypothetical protein